jgi:prepilin peptidase CpaA
VGKALAIPLVIVLVAAIIAAVTDIWKFRVHNVLTLPLLGSGILYHGLVGGAAGLTDSLSGALFGFSALMVFYLIGGMGGGDVKLMAGVGAWLGMPLTFYVFMVGSLAAGTYATILVLASGKVRDTWINLLIAWHRLVTLSKHLGAEQRIEPALAQTNRRQRIVPFAAMVAFGVIATCLWNWRK